MGARVWSVDQYMNGLEAWRGCWTREDREENYYRYLPFELPNCATGVTVRLAYDRRSAVLDLGCFDPNGFRGWSGGERDEFSITETWATPGYLPGRLPGGKWLVCLGLYQVPPGGIAWAAEVQLGNVERPQQPLRPAADGGGPERVLPAGRGRHWLAGDLHAHSEHSDGKLDLDELASLARSRGLDFLAVTDHNTVSHHAELERIGRRNGIALVPGQELTTPKGHANCLGGVGWLDFRKDPDQWLETAEARGGLLSVNHPLAADWGWQFTGHRQFPLTEVWHGSWDQTSSCVIDWWRSRGETVAVGGSDFHRLGHEALPGSPTTWVEAEGDDVLGALREGRVAVSAEPTGPLVLPIDDEVVVLDGDGTTLVSESGQRQPIIGDRVTTHLGSGLHLLMAQERAVGLCVVGPRAADG